MLSWSYMFSLVLKGDKLIRLVSLGVTWSVTALGRLAAAPSGAVIEPPISRRITWLIEEKFSSGLLQQESASIISEYRVGMAIVWNSIVPPADMRTSMASFILK